TTDEWFRHIFHFNRGLHPCLYSDLRAGTLQRQTINHGSEHSHVISSRAIHPAMSGGSAAPDVSSADDNADLHAQIAHLLDPLGNSEDDLRRNILPRASGLKRLAA